MPWTRRTSAWQQGAEFTLAIRCKVCRCLCRNAASCAATEATALPGERVLLAVLQNRRLLTPQLEAQLQQVAAPTGHKEVMSFDGALACLAT